MWMIDGDLEGWIYCGMGIGGGCVVPSMNMAVLSLLRIELRGILRCRERMCCIYTGPVRYAMKVSVRVHQIPCYACLSIALSFSHPFSPLTFFPSTTSMLPSLYQNASTTLYLIPKHRLHHTLY